MSRVKIAAITIVAVLAALVGLITILAIDGRMYERWRGAQELKQLRAYWLREGKPEVSKWEPVSSSGWHGKLSVHIRLYKTPVREYTTLFHYVDDHAKHPLAITKEGDILVLKKDGSARSIWMHPTRGAAW
jgi:hypothetical protein